METGKIGGGIASAARGIAGEEMVYIRTVNAPPALVYQAWTGLQHLKIWWKPAGFTWMRGTLRLRPGGVFHYCVRSSNGEAMWAKLTYRKTDEPRRLEFIASFSNERQRTVRAPFSLTWPLEILVTAEFHEHRGGTDITLSGRPWNATEEERRSFIVWHDALRQGFSDKLDQLEEYLARTVLEQRIATKEIPGRRVRIGRRAARY